MRDNRYVKIVTADGACGHSGSSAPADQDHMTTLVSVMHELQALSTPFQLKGPIQLQTQHLQVSPEINQTRDL